MILNSFTDSTPGIIRYFTVYDVETDEEINCIYVDDCRKRIKRSEDSNLISREVYILMDTNLKEAQRFNQLSFKILKMREEGSEYCPAAEICHLQMENLALRLKIRLMKERS